MENETKLFVSLLLPFHDGSGVPEVLGVYSNREKAEARCYREVCNLGYDQPTAIVESILDNDEENPYGH